jgi:hypothetical protein
LSSGVCESFHPVHHPKRKRIRLFVAIEHKEIVNPVFRALSGAHSRFALTGTSILLYQPDVLPFAAVSETATGAHEAG